MLKPWRERFPGRLEYELDKLKEIGISCEPQFTGDTVFLEFPYVLDGEVIDLIVKFPSSYPYLRFTIDAPSIGLKHHWNPFTNDLCILGRATVNWEADDTVAETLRTQMPKVIKAGRSNDIDEVKELEENQPEPVSAYFKTSDFLFIDGNFQIGGKYTGKWGNLEIGVNHRNRLAVLAIDNANDERIASINPHIEKIFKDRLNGRWIRIDSPIIENNPYIFLQKLVLVEPRLKSPRWQRLPNNLYIDVIAVVFPEEIEQRESGEGWLFLVRIKR